MSASVVFEQFPFSARRSATENKKTKAQRIYIMPTRHGLLFGLMLFAMLLGAINYNNSMAFILTFLLCSLLMLTLLHTCRNLAGLAINETTPAPVFAGELAEFPLILDNRAGHLRISISFIKATDKWRWRSNKQHSTITTCDVDENEFNHIGLSFKTSQRGLLRPGRIKVFTVFPLGLFKAWSYIDMQQACIVYPKPAGQDSFPPFKLLEESGVSGIASGTDDFIGFRNYHAGDSIKDIAWKAYAQQKGLFIKRFSGAGSDKLHLSWQDVAHLPDIELRLSQLCHWLIEAESQSFHYALDIPDVSIASGQGENHLHQCLSELAKFGLKNET